jgi:hypothetical protein
MMTNSLAGPEQHASVSQIKDIPKSKGSQLGVNATENWKHASCGIRSAVGTCNAESGDCPSNKHSTMVCCAEQFDQLAGRASGTSVHGKEETGKETFTL